MDSGSEAGMTHRKGKNIRKFTTPGVVEEKAMKILFTDIYFDCVAKIF